MSSYTLFLPVKKHCAILEQNSSTSSSAATLTSFEFLWSLDMCELS